MRLWQAITRAAVFAAAIGISQVAAAGVIRSPVAVVANTFVGPIAGNTAPLIDQSGLSLHFTSGVTDFATYLGGNPSHAACDFSTCWASGPGHGHMDFDLGSVLQISSFVLWLDGNDVNDNDVNRFNLTSASDSLFSSGVTDLGAFDTVENGDAQVFNVNGVGRFVRLTVLSNHGTNFNDVMAEVAFNTSSVPEPATLALLSLGIGGLGLFRPARPQRSTLK